MLKTFLSILIVFQPPDEAPTKKRIEETVMTVNKPFLHANRGNTGLIFALSAVPLILGAGAAIDMVRYNQAQTTLQAATDAAALAAINNPSITGVELTGMINDYLVNNGLNNAVDAVTEVTPNRDTATGAFSLTVKGKLNTSLMALAGINTMDVSAFAEAQSGNRALEVALVLDNTGSMNYDGRLPALKTAAQDLVDTLMKDKTASQYTKIGIVPFATYVNVGTANSSAAWLNLPASQTYSSDNCSYTYPNKTNCRMETASTTVDGQPSTYQYEACDWGTPEITCAPVSYSVSWAGCVGSRNAPRDETVADASVRYPGLSGVNCPAEILPLTDNHGLLTSKISSLWGSGDTYIAQGLLWGWNLLDPAEPFAGAMTSAEISDSNGVKALVLMTDGDNTRSASYPSHDNTDTAAADAKTAALCEAVKAQGIKVFTVALMVTNASSQKMLQDCASEPDMAFNAEDNAQMQQAFANIAGTLAAIRLTQ